jgi:cytochrome c biogenesis protein CcmG/thiol:disulfide interchange protein DsbE
MEINSQASHITQKDQKEAALATLPARKRSRKRSITIFILVSVLNVALLILLWTQLLTPAQQNNSAANSASNSTTLSGDVTSFPLKGKPMVDFTLPTLNGSTKTIHLADLKGHPIILNFWASWCDPCQQEAPFLAQEWPRLKAQGVILIGIDGQEVKQSDGVAFLQKYHISYLNVEDTMDGSTIISYGVTGFPETFFINRQGIVVAKWISALNAQGLKMETAKILE